MEVDDFTKTVRMNLTDVLYRYHQERVGAVADERVPAHDESPSAAGAVPEPEWEERYLRELEEELEQILLPMPPLSGARRCELSSVYVPLELRLESFSGSAASPRAALLASKRVAVTGGAGAGKSTLLRHVTLELVRRRLAAHAPGVTEVETAPPTSGDSDENTGHARLPIYLSLLDVVGQLKDLTPASTRSTAAPGSR